MQINQADAKTLELISQHDAYQILAREPAFSTIITAFEQALENAPGFTAEENLSNYIQTKIRLELINIFKSREIKQYNKKVYEAAFQFLLLLANYWPLNAIEVAGNANTENKYKCPITLCAIEEDDKAITISGYLFSKTALQEYWVANPAYRHPVFNAKVTNREIKHIFDQYHRPIHSPALPQRTPARTRPFLSLRTEDSDFYIGVGMRSLSLGIVVGVIIGGGVLIAFGAPLILAVGIGLGSWFASFVVMLAINQSIKPVVNAVNYLHGIFHRPIEENVQPAPAPAPVLNAHQHVSRTARQVTTAINNINNARVPLLEIEQPVVINVAPEVAPDLQHDGDILQPGLADIQINEIAPAPVVPLPEPAPAIQRQRSVIERRAGWMNQFFPPRREEQQIEGQQEVQVEGYAYQRMAS